MKKINPCKMINKICGTIIFLFCAGFVLGQTKPMFSQYMFNMLVANPAYAGIRNSTSFTALYRRQWVGVPGAPNTSTIAADFRQPGNNWGFGAHIYNDGIGIEKTAGIQLNVAKHFIIDPKSNPINNPLMLSLGISGGVMNYKANFTSVQTIVPGDPAFNTVINAWAPTAGMGLILSRGNWYVGISLPTALKVTFLSNNQKSVTSLLSESEVFTTAGVVLGNPESNIKWKPSIMYRLTSGAPATVDLNMNAWYEDLISVGFSYRTSDAFIGLVELRLSPQIRMGYAYDYTRSVLNINSRGTHEFMLRFDLGQKGEPIRSPFRDN